MDYSNLSIVELTAVSNAFAQMESILEDFLPANFPKLLEEYLSMDEESRIELLGKMSAKANFMAYAESIGNEGMADALIKVADDMKGMSTRELKSVASGGLSKLAEK
jgi:hypothetical protein